MPNHDYFTMAEQYRNHDDKQLMAELQNAVDTNKVAPVHMVFVQEVTTRRAHDVALLPAQRVKIGNILTGKI